MEIVYDKPMKEPKINIEGNKGESLFHRPVIWAVKNEFNRIREQFEHYKKLIEEIKDERLLALIGAMSMEEALDSFLGAYILDYKRIVDFTLSMKIQIAFSLRLIPGHILHTADLIRAIRNEFVHELSINCFDSLDSNKFKDKMRARFKELFPDNTNTSLILKDMFICIVEAIILGLGIYASHLDAAKEYIYSEDFLKELNKRIKSKA